MTRILLLDDDLVIQVAVQNLIAALGWHVDVTVDVHQALLAVLDAPERYDAAVLDLELPDGRGDEVAPVLALLHPAAHVVLHTGRLLPGPPPGVHVYLAKDRGLLALLEHLQAALAR